MKKTLCEKCNRNIDGYCIEYDDSIDNRKECKGFLDKTYAEWLCDLMCPCPED